MANPPFFINIVLIADTNHIDSFLVDFFPLSFGLFSGRVHSGCVPENSQIL